MPFDGESAGEILMKHLTPPPDLTAVPSPFVPILDKALCKNPANRYRTMAEMAKDVQRTEPPSSVLDPLGDSASPNGKLADTVAEPIAMPTVSRHSRSWPARCYWRPASPVLLGLAWEILVQPGNNTAVLEFFCLATACSWCVLIPAKTWQGQADDSWPRRFIMTALGLALGVVAVWLEGQPLDDVLYQASSTARLEALQFMGLFGLSFFLMRGGSWRNGCGRCVSISAPWCWPPSWHSCCRCCYRSRGIGTSPCWALTAGAAIVQIVSPWQPPQPGARGRNDCASRRKVLGGTP